MNKQNKYFLVYGLLLLLLLILLAGFVAAEQKSCKDTDLGAFDYDHKGMATGMNGKSMTDYCTDGNLKSKLFQGFYVVEHYCNSVGKVANSMKKCSQMCKDGACVYQPGKKSMGMPLMTGHVVDGDASKCVDTDVIAKNEEPEKSPFHQPKFTYINKAVQGTVTFQGKPYDDKCKDGKLVEYFCNNVNAGYASKTYTCPSGTTCQEGACVSSSPTVDIGTVAGALEVEDKSSSVPSATPQILAKIDFSKFVLPKLPTKMAGIAGASSSKKSDAKKAYVKACVLANRDLGFEEKNLAKFCGCLYDKDGEPYLCLKYLVGSEEDSTSDQSSKTPEATSTPEETGEDTETKEPKGVPTPEEQLEKDVDNFNEPTTDPLPEDATVGTVDKDGVRKTPESTPGKKEYIKECMSKNSFKVPAGKLRNFCTCMFDNNGDIKLCKRELGLKGERVTPGKESTGGTTGGRDTSKETTSKLKPAYDETKKKPAEPTEIVCFDSDGGKNLGVKGNGKGYGSSAKKEIELWDICNKGEVIELQCLDMVPFVAKFLPETVTATQFLATTSYACPQGTACDDGACVEKALGPSPAEQEPASPPGGVPSGGAGKAAGKTKKQCLRDTDCPKGQVCSEDKLCVGKGTTTAPGQKGKTDGEKKGHLDLGGITAISEKQVKDTHEKWRKLGISKRKTADQTAEQACIDRLKNSAQLKVKFSDKDLKRACQCLVAGKSNSQCLGDLYGGKTPDQETEAEAEKEVTAADQVVEQKEQEAENSFVTGCVAGVKGIKSFADFTEASIGKYCTCLFDKGTECLNLLEKPGETTPTEEQQPETPPAEQEPASPPGGVPSGGAGKSAGKTKQQCVRDTDCQKDQICRNNLCVGKGEKTCDRDTDCPKGQVCSEDKLCVGKGTKTALGQKGKTDEEKTGDTGDKGSPKASPDVTVKKPLGKIDTTVQQPEAGKATSKVGDKPTAGLRTDGGKKPQPGKPTGKPCSNDVDCGEGQVCNRALGQCVILSPQTPPATGGDKDKTPPAKNGKKDDGSNKFGLVIAAVPQLKITSVQPLLKKVVLSKMPTRSGDSEQTPRSAEEQKKTKYVKDCLIQNDKLMSDKAKLRGFCACLYDNGGDKNKCDHYLPTRPKSTGKETPAKPSAKKDQRLDLTKLSPVDRKQLEGHRDKWSKQGGSKRKTTDQSAEQACVDRLKKNKKLALKFSDKDMKRACQCLVAGKPKSQCLGDLYGGKKQDTATTTEADKEVTVADKVVEQKEQEAENSFVTGCVAGVKGIKAFADFTEASISKYCGCLFDQGTECLNLLETPVPETPVSEPVQTPEPQQPETTPADEPAQPQTEPEMAPEPVPQPVTQCPLVSQVCDYVIDNKDMVSLTPGDETEIFKKESSLKIKFEEFGSDGQSCVSLFAVCDAEGVCSEQPLKTMAAGVHINFMSTDVKMDGAFCLE